jgi:magnesium transporter
MNHHIVYADDDSESVELLLRLRIPSLFIGLSLGIFLSFVTSQFETVLAQNIHVAFFIPFIVYIAAAVGAQTQSIYTRDVRSGKAHFLNYLKKEFILGIILGLVFGAISGLIVLVWFSDSILALAISISACIAITSSPLLALFTTEGLRRLSEDPAAWAGPLANVLQDMLSVVIYGIVCSIIIL